VIERLLEVMDRFGGQRLLLVGDFMLDRYLYGDAERISAEAPVPVLRILKKEQRLGGAGSVASNLTALGVEAVAVVGVVGDDDAGREVRKLLEQLRVNTAGLLAVQDRPTTTKTRVVGLAQHRHRQQLLRLDEEDGKPLDAACRQALVSACEDLLRSQRFDAVLIEDYDKGVVDAEMVSAVLELAGRREVPVLADPAAIGDFSRYRGVDVLTPNRSEFAQAVGRNLSSLGQVGKEAQRLIEQLRLKWMVVTLDREGSLLVERESWRHIPARPRDVYDNTGAGDAVLAMLGAALAAGANVDEAVHLANVAGGLEVEKFGCVPITCQEVVSDLWAERRKSGRKRLDLKSLCAELERHRKAGKKIVFTNGCFDLLHVGHVELLRFCKRHGDIVVVGLNSDRSVKVNKGPERPILNQDARAAMLEALESVDYIVIFDEPDPSRLIERVRPDVLVKGQDWAGKWVCGKGFVESYGGKVLLAPLVEGYSTTKLIERARSSGGDR